MSKWILHAGPDPDVYVVAVAASSEDAVVEIHNAIALRQPSALLKSMAETIASGHAYPAQLADDDSRGSHAAPLDPEFHGLD
jgi:hypothetical protein